MITERFITKMILRNLMGDLMAQEIVDWLEALEKVRVWPRDWRDRVLMDNVGGRTEIFMCKIKRESRNPNVKRESLEPFWWQVPVSRDIVAVVAHDRNRKVCLVQQLRPAWDDKENGIWVLPAGGIPVDLDDPKLIGKEAMRELKEETGCECEEPELLTTVLCSGRIRSKQHIYMTEITEQSSSSQELTEHERKMVLDFDWFDIDVAIGKFTDEKREDYQETTGYTLLGLLLAKKELERQEEEKSEAEETKNI